MTDDRHSSIEPDAILPRSGLLEFRSGFHAIRMTSDWSIREVFSLFRVTIGAVLPVVAAVQA